MMKRNVTLDYSKLVFAIMMILFHYPLMSISEYETFSVMKVVSKLYDNGIARIVVPFFFIVNGYYLSVNNLQKLKKYLLHLLLIFVIWQLLYLPWFAESNPLSVLFLLINGYEHLWYVMALIIGAALLYFYVNTVKNKKILLALTIILPIIGYIIQVQDYSIYLYRNFLFVGFPFISMGYLIRNTDITKYAKSAKYVAIAMIAVIMLESYGIFLYPKRSDILLSLIVITPAIFITILSKSKFKESDSYISDLSAAVYFAHFGIVKVIFACAKPIFGVTLYSSTLFLLPLTIITSLIVGAIIIHVNKRIKIFL